MDDPTCGRCHKETETASHTLRECVALVELRFCILGKHFMEPSDMMRFRDVRYCTSLEARDYWRNKVDVDAQ
jgi:hypothetical protein